MINSMWIRSDRIASGCRKRANLFCGILLGCFVAYPASADIAQRPLIVVDAAESNLIVAIDNSGSMDGEILLRTNDGAAWWNTAHESFYGLGRQDATNSDRFNFNEDGAANGTWKKYVYLFPNGTGSGDRVYNNASHDHFPVPPTAEFAWTRSPAFNALYFDPYQIYEPWVSNGTQSFDDVDPAEAPSDPVVGSSTVDLTDEIDRNDGDWRFVVQDGMNRPGGGDYDNQDEIGFEYYPATFYVVEGTDLPPPYDQYTGSTLDGSSPDGTSLTGYEIREGNFSSEEAYEEAIQNFANWFTYHRKRHLATRAGVGAGFNDIIGLRAGMFTINNRNNVDMVSLSEFDQRQAFYDDVYAVGGNSAGTPNPQAIDHAGQQFQRTDDNAPIQLECQRNATLLFTDGYANQWNNAGVGNADGGRGEPFEDDQSNTMADIAMNYYDGDDVPLRGDLPTGDVPVDQDCPDDREDCVSDLHMQTFGITLGALGEIFGQNMDATEDPFANPPDWPTSFPNRHPSAVDDLWHATVNTRADMIDATNSTALAKAFREIASQVRADVGASAAVASNSTRLDTDTRIYQARFRSQRWSGELLAFDLDSDTGAISNTPEWNAAENIPEPSDRDIYSYNPDTDSGFSWPQSTLDTGLFSVDQIDALNRDATGATDGRGEERLEWLRGNAIADFREREVLPDGTVNLLGDIVNSDPVLVGDQDFGFRSLPNEEAADAYAPFIRDVKRERPEVLYVGANDGMLHAFNAETGEELFAFVPDEVYDNLSLLTDPEYEHRYFVDGSSRVLDAYIDHDGDGTEEWRTILLGATGAGGSSIFALDVTDPENFGPDDVLWEINKDTLEADTGYGERLGSTIGQPSIVSLSESDRWAAVFGNGYGSESGTAQLFVVDLESGDPVVEPIDTEAAGDAGTPNGLSSGLTVDINGDRVTDRVYAGDLQGNLWRFDLDSNNTGQWGSAFSQGQTPEPLFVAEDDDGERQPITARPIGARNPDGDVMIFFGSGKLFENGDNEVDVDPRVESFYGVKDRDSDIGGRADLLEQTILAESDEPGGRFRVTSDNGISSTDDGWYIDLVSPENGAEGERVIEPAVLTSGDDIDDTRVAFTTAIPESDPCSFGGSGWFMQLQAWNGSRPDGSIFDVNNDGVIDGDDLVDDQGVGGKSMDDIVTTPAIIKTGGGTEFNYMSGASGELYKEETDSPAGDELGRQSWRQLR